MTKKVMAITHWLVILSQAEAKINAEKAFELFIETYQDKYPKATLTLKKDREELLAFYDFPAKHWQSIRTGNPIESTFGTIRHMKIQGLSQSWWNVAHDV